MKRGPRIAILGVGHWHTPRQVLAFQRAGARITAVQDTDQAIADRWARELGCASYTRVEAAVWPDQLEGALVLSPSDQVPGVLHSLIAAELPFALEKPGAIQAAAILEACVASEALGLFTAVAFINRYSAFWPTVSAMRASGELEQVVSARFRVINGSPQRYIDDGVEWVLSRDTFGGGALRNIGSHAVDAALQLAGAGTNVLGAAVDHRSFELDVEDYAVALLQATDGTAITIEAGYGHPLRDGTDHEWSVSGPTARIRESESALEILSSSGSRTVPTPDIQGRYDLFASDVVRGFSSGAPAAAPLRAAYDALAVIDQIYAASSVRASPIRL